jgi:hypothetical protein
MGHREEIQRNQADSSWRSFHPLRVKERKIPVQARLFLDILIIEKSDHQKVE